MSKDLGDTSRRGSVYQNPDDPEDTGRITVIGLQSAKTVRRSSSVAEAWEGWQDWGRTPPYLPSTAPALTTARGKEEETNREQDGDDSEEEGGTIDDWIVPQRLAKVLSGEPDFCATQRKLQQQLGHAGNALTRTVNVFGKTFRLNKDVVELRPQVAVCEEHISEDGCHAYLCLELHICPQFVERSCDNPRCGLGHEWYTDHNRQVLQDFYLDNLNTNILHNLLACTLSSDGPFGPLDICNDYNDETIGCSGGCITLHICRTFVEGVASCHKDKCSLSHSFTEFHNQWLLKIHGLPVNETPRDIVRALIECNAALTIPLPPQPPTPIPDPSSSSVSSDSEDSDEGETLYNTQWSHCPSGDVQIPAICEASVVGLCSHEDKGCTRLHAPEHYHWQVSENCFPWYNLRQHQVECLERSFCDPRQQGQTLPLLKPRAVEPWWKTLINLLGPNTCWLADFNMMQLVSGQRQLHLRRLCTGGGENEWSASTFLWYRKLSNELWQEYSGDQGEDAASSITSEDIEKKWLEDPTQTIVCPGNCYNVSIDFKTMKETVSITQNERQVRRRPKPHLRGDPIYQGGPYQVLDVATFNPDYDKVKCLLEHAATSYSCIKIKKIDNLLLRRAFQIRVEEMKQQSQETVEVRHMFQVLDPTMLSVVCAENFDWRHQQRRRSSLKYGRGCYFYTNACEALEQGPTSSQETQRLLVVNVAVSSWTRGDVTMVAPPFIPNTGIRHDATTDKPDQPTFFVKYQSHDYYPEYLVILH